MFLGQWREISRSGHWTAAARWMYSSEVTVKPGPLFHLSRLCRTVTLRSGVTRVYIVMAISVVNKDQKEKLDC